jgi:hypothetical protein
MVADLELENKKLKQDGDSSSKSMGSSFGG